MYRIICFLVSFLVFFSVSQLAAQEETLTVKSPPDGAFVPERPIVEGLVTDSTAKVWVIVHPMETSDYWVQPAVTVRKGGVWRNQIYIGRPGNVDVGKHFEIMAVANPTQQLREGKVLGGWPEGQWSSEVIELIRR